FSRRPVDGELSGSDLIDVAEGLERASERVTSELRSRGFARGVPIAASEPALQALAVGSAVLGIRGASARDPLELLGALLAPTPTGAEGESGELAHLRAVAVKGMRRASGDSFFGERELVNRDAARAWLLRRIALRQSPQAVETEAVHAADAARLMAAITEIAAKDDFNSVPASAG